jgi:Ca2+/Na+ antiporter
MDRNNALTWRQYLFGAITILIVMLSSLLLMRQVEFQKDILLYDSLIFFCGVILVRMFLLLFLEKIKVALIFCLVAALYFSFIQFNGLLLNHKTISIHNYNYQISPWKDFSFGFRQNQYRELMADSYPLSETWSTVFSAAKNINSTKLSLDQLFRNNEIKLSNTSLGAEGAFLNKARIERIKKISPELKGSIIVPLIKKNSTVEIHSRSDLLIYILTTDSSIKITGHVEPINLPFETDEDLSGKKYYAYILKSGGTHISLNDLPVYIAIKSD